MEPVYTSGKVIGIAKRMKIKTDSSLIYQFLYLFFRFYTVIVLDYFSVTVPVSVDGNNYANWSSSSRDTELTITN